MMQHIRFHLISQRDFFDLFRQVKSKIISPEAAVSPGVTNYSPNFRGGTYAVIISMYLLSQIAMIICFMKRILNGEA